MPELIAAESAARGFDPALVERYLTHNVVFSLGPEELAGREAYLRYAEELQRAVPEPALPLEASR